VHAAEQGIGVCELAESAAHRDSTPWANILDWMQQHDRQNDTVVTAVSRVMPFA
jgi:hypothetical protein